MLISGALLAAGSSARMGKNKLLLPYGRHTVVEESLSQLVAAEPDEILVVTGYQKDEIRKRIYYMGGGLRIVHNPNYRDGRSESIKCAVNNIDDNSDALLFMVADKPTVKAELINRAMAVFRKHSPILLYVRTPAGRGHPVIFSRKIFDELLNLKSEPVGNSLFERHRAESLIIADDNIQMDIDTPEDYEEVLRSGSL